MAVIRNPGIIEYQWFDENFNPIEGATQTTITVSSPGVYYLQGIDDANGCENIDTVEVFDVSSFPEIEAGPDLLIPCETEGIQIFASSNGQNNLNYNWTTQGGNIVSTSNPLTPVVDQPGWYYVQVVDAVNGCTALDSIFVEEAESPYAAQSNEIDISCYGEGDGQLEIFAVAGGTGSYIYELEGVGSNTSGLFTDLEEGNYVLNIIDENGCVFDTILPIEEPEEITALFNPAFAQYECGTSIQVQIETSIDISQIDTFIWNTIEGLSCTQCLNPVISSNFSENYEVTIIDVNGCEATARISVAVDSEAEVYIPNIFYPKSTTGNDNFHIKAGPGVQMITEFYVFDRWGSKMFEDFNFLPNDPAHGWDGSFRDQFVVPGVYAYLVKYIDCQGNIQLEAGDVTAIF